MEIKFDGDPSLDAGGASKRNITLELAAETPRVQPGALLSRLEFGATDGGLSWAAMGSAEADKYVEGGKLQGSRGRRVTIAVPLDQLDGVTGAKEGSFDHRLNPRSFSWRLSVVADCMPSRDAMITFPAGNRVKVVKSGIRVCR